MDSEIPLQITEDPSELLKNLHHFVQGSVKAGHRTWLKTLSPLLLCLPNGEPYYPVPSVKNQQLYKKYQVEAQKLEENGIYFVGRLANYKYFNMDQAFKNALDLFKKHTQI